jgi:hypothetical protein
VGLIIAHGYVYFYLINSDHLITLICSRACLLKLRHVLLVSHQIVLIFFFAEDAFPCIVIFCELSITAMYPFVNETTAFPLRNSRTHMWMKSVNHSWIIPLRGEYLNMCFDKRGQRRLTESKFIAGLTLRSGHNPEITAFTYRCFRLANIRAH